METTYTMIGSDGRQYGPITLAQMKTWILEGRIAGDTRILRSDTNSWLTAAQYPELGLGGPTAPTSPPPLAAPGAPGVIRAPAVSTVDPMLQRRARSAGRWFFWIAGLSLVNIFMANSENGGAFVVGLAITLLLSGTAVGNAVSIAVAGVFALFGVFASKRQEWSFIVGMILYALDALLAASGPDWLMVAFHVLVLIWLFRGWQAIRQLKAQATAA